MLPCLNVHNIKNHRRLYVARQLSSEIGHLLDRTSIVDSNAFFVYESFSCLNYAKALQHHMNGRVMAITLNTIINIKRI